MRVRCLTSFSHVWDYCWCSLCTSATCTSISFEFEVKAEDRLLGLVPILALELVALILFQILLFSNFIISNFTISNFIISNF